MGAESVRRGPSRPPKVDISAICSIFVLMQSAAPCPASDADILHEMVLCAHALGKAAGELAQAAKDDVRAFCELSAEFRHCFFAVRMGIRLGLNLRAAPARAATLPRPETEYERAETEPADHHD